MNHIKAANNARQPETRKANCQLWNIMHQAISGGASIAPKDVPVLKKPAAIPRSLAGNHVDTVLIPAGKTEASLTPISPRIKARLCHDPANACPIVASPQIIMQMKKLNFSPMRSIKNPMTGCPIVYANWKALTTHEYCSLVIPIVCIIVGAATPNAVLSR